MTDKQIIIDDQRKTIHRLQDECTEKTNAIIALGEQFKRKEQECAMLRKMFADIDSANVKLHNKIDQLKTELHHKTEYIQEQRDIINQYSKEIEMYKKCQGKRASKREEELKAELEQYKKSKQTSYEASQKKCNELELKSRRLAETLMEIYQYIKSYLFRGGVEPQWVEWQMAQREKEKMAKDIFKILQKYKVVLNDVIGEQ